MPKNTLLRNIELLRELSTTFGPSGCEKNVANLIRTQITGFCDSLYTDKLGNVIAKIQGHGENYRPDVPKPVMLSAHMDEVGFMVTHIDGDGYVKFTTVGGIDAKVMLGKNVILGNEDNQISGIIGVKPVHLQSSTEKNAVPEVDSLYIDIGAEKKEDAEKYISSGDFITFDSKFIEYGIDNSLIVGKAIDDRLGCAVLCEVMRAIWENKSAYDLDHDIYFAFTTREEVGLSGAEVAAYAINPKRAIVIETTAVADISGVEKHQRVAELGEGGALSLMDNGTIYDRDYVNYALDLAEKNNIKAQIKKYVSGGNDAKHIQGVRSGVKLIAISAPARYLHSSSNVISKNDYYAIRKLVEKLACANL